MYSELLVKTKALMELCSTNMQRLEDIKHKEEFEVDFYREVKPFVDKVMSIADSWRELSKSWIRAEQPKYLHPNQIDATHENIQLISIQSFYQDTKVKRFKNMYESIMYVLDNIMEKITN